MALAEKMLSAEFGKRSSIIKLYVLASDGDLMEAFSQEAIAMAGHWKLNKLIVLYDDNAFRSTARPRFPTRSDQVKRFKSAGWQAELIDGQDQAADRSGDHPRESLQQAVDDRLQDHDRLRRANKAGTAKAHGEALGAD